MSQRIVRYSEAFKLKVVGEVERGRFVSAYAAAQAYGITGKGTVGRWLRAYGKSHLLGQVIRVETDDEMRELKRLRARVKALETALADAVMDQALESATLELLCEQTGTDLAAFKKKAAGSASGGRTKKRDTDRT